MKNKNISKLVLNKTVVAALNNDQLTNVIGAGKTETKRICNTGDTCIIACDYIPTYYFC